MEPDPTPGGETYADLAERDALEAARCRGCATSLATCWAEGARCCDACAHPKDTP